MHRYLEAVLSFPQKTARALLAEASVLREVVADVRRYASKRWRMRKRGTLPDPNSFEKALNRIIIDAANSLIEAKKNVAVAIADEKRLAVHTRQEQENSTEWSRRAEIAEERGDAALAGEARARACEHAALEATFKAQWTSQLAAVDELKGTLRALNARIEQAKRDRNRIILAHAVASAHDHMVETRQEMEETIRILDRLSGMAARVEEVDVDDDADDVADDDKGPLH